MERFTVSANIRAALVALLIVMSFPSLGKAQYYPDRLSDVSWSPGNFVTVADIQTAFNNARTNENAQILGAGQVVMPMMTMPTQSEWDAMSKSQKAVWLINSERVARGLLPFQGVDPNVIGVAQAQADWLMANNLFQHEGPGGNSPWQRLDANPAIGGHHDFLPIAENIFAFYSFPGPNPMTIERAVYGWNYVDASSSWGHRHAFLLLAFTNNFGDAGSEGLMGIGSATGAYGSGCGCPGDKWPAGDVLVYNVFDPDATYAGPLPVQVSSFTGSVTSDHDVRLQWTTISEVNNYGFFVQRRSSQQDTFADLPNNFLPGHGTTNVPQQYELTDTTPLNGAGFYRLKQVDLDGSVYYSDEISVNTLTGVNEQTPVEFSLNQNYPNPFNPTTTIQFGLPAQSRVSLTVYDMLGREVARIVDGEMGAGTHRVQFNASSLASGVYAYRIQVAGDNGASFSNVRQMVVMK